MDSKVLEPDLIVSSDGKEVLYASDPERLRREKQLIDFLASCLCTFFAGGEA